MKVKSKDVLQEHVPGEVVYNEKKQVSSYVVFYFFID